MSKATIFNYVTGESNIVKDERYENLGSGEVQLGTIKRAFIEDDFSIQENDSNGTELEKDVDYEFINKDAEYTSLEGIPVWTGIQIINASYEIGLLYVTYKAIGSYTDGDFTRDLRSDLDTAQDDITTLQAQSAGINLLTKIANYTILDANLASYGTVLIYVNPTAGNVTITLPTLADNIGKKVQIIVIDDTNLCQLIGEGAETIEGLATIELPKQGNRVTVIGQASEWKIVEENIACQLRLDTYAGHGSTDDKIVRLTNVVENIGNMFTENHVSGYDSDAEGLEITIAKSGKYSFSVSNYQGDSYIGLTLNSAQLTTGIQSASITDRLTISYSASAQGSAWSGYLDVGDIVRLHDSGGASAGVVFTATYIGS